MLREVNPSLQSSQAFKTKPDMNVHKKSSKLNLVISEIMNILDPDLNLK